MNLAETILRDVSAAGGIIAVRDGQLKLSAPKPLPQALIERVRIAKPVLLAALHPPAVWDATDWLAYYDERAGIYEYDGKLSRPDAERQAFDACISHWMNKNPPAHGNPDICPQCDGTIIMAANNTIAVLKKGGYLWLHDKCWQGWYDRRKQEAAEALASIGIIWQGGISC